MSNPTWPVYTFRVNLETLQRYSASQPYRTITEGNETVSEADNMKNTRSTWLGLLPANVQNLVKKHGDEFTLYGLQAKKVKDLYTGSTDSVLQVV